MTGSDDDDLVWVHFRTDGPRWLYHAASSWRGDPAKAPRWSPACGDVNTSKAQLDEQGNAWCLACLARMAGRR